jgi:hypothetical protein
MRQDKVMGKVVRKVGHMMAAGGLLWMASAPMAWAQPMAELADGALERLEVAHVQPVIYADSGAQQDVGAVLAQLSTLGDQDEARAARLTGSKLAAVELNAADEGLGFAGTSRASDIEALRVGHALGSLPLLYQVAPSRFKLTTAQLAHMPRVPGVNEETQRAVNRFVYGAQGGRIDQAGYMALMEVAQRGIATSEDVDGQRAHGYLLVGLWSGLAQLEVEASGAPSSRLVSSGQALIRLLEEDAAHGGSDLKLAAHLKAMVSELGSGRASAERMATLASALLDVQADG